MMVSSVLGPGSTSALSATSQEAKSAPAVGNMRSPNSTSSLTTEATDLPIALAIMPHQESDPLPISGKQAKGVIASEQSFMVSERSRRYSTARALVDTLLLEVPQTSDMQPLRASGTLPARIASQDLPKNSTSLVLPSMKFQPSSRVRSRVTSLPLKKKLSSKGLRFCVGSRVAGMLNRHGRTR